MPKYDYNISQLCYTIPKQSAIRVILLCTQALCLKHLCVCIYKQRGIITSYCSLPKTFQFLADKNCINKEVTRFFFRTASSCMHDSVCPKKRIITIVKSSQNITISSIQKPHKDSKSHLSSTFQAENTLLPTPGSCVRTARCYTECVPAFSCKQQCNCVTSYNIKDLLCNRYVK